MDSWLFFFKSHPRPAAATKHTGGYLCAVLEIDAQQLAAATALQSENGSFLSRSPPPAPARRGRQAGNNTKRRLVLVRRSLAECEGKRGEAWRWWWVGFRSWGRQALALAERIPPRPASKAP